MAHVLASGLAARRRPDSRRTKIPPVPICQGARQAPNGLSTRCLQPVYSIRTLHSQQGEILCPAVFPNTEIRNLGLASISTRASVRRLARLHICR